MADGAYDQLINLIAATVAQHPDWDHRGVLTEVAAGAVPGGDVDCVVMAAGLTANLTANPLDAVTTVTVQIVTLLTGDQEFDSAKTLSAFALGLVLFVATLLLNVVALHILRTYREKYD